MITQNQNMEKKQMDKDSLIVCITTDYNYKEIAKDIGFFKV